MRRRHPTHSDAASSSSAILKFIHNGAGIIFARVAQLVEFQISNLAVARSYLVTCSICGYTQAVEEVCLENTQGCKSLRGFESSYPRGITEKPSRGDAVFTNSLYLLRQTSG